MRYSMLFQNSPSSGMSQWINPCKYRISTITSMTVLFTPNQVMFNNVDSTTNVVTYTNDEERMITPDYYTFGGGHLHNDDNPFRPINVCV